MDCKYGRHSGNGPGFDPWKKRPISGGDHDMGPNKKYLRQDTYVEKELLTPDSPEQNFDFPSNSSTSSNKTFLCRLCNNDTAFKNETDFDIHLTVIHFRERLLKLIQAPFKCISCGYIPMSTMSPEEQSDDLLMHYGCKEKRALRLYHDEVARLPQLKVEKDSDTISIVCKLCESTFDSERLFVRHISLRHFTKELCDELPKLEPFICPFIDCGQEKDSHHNLMLHYGCEHNISMELYQKLTGATSPSDLALLPTPVGSHRSPTGCSSLFSNYLQKVSTKRPSLPTPVPSFLPPVSATQSSTSLIIPATHSKPKFPVPSVKPKETRTVEQLQYICKFCNKKPKFSTQKSLQYHILFSHFFTNLPQTGQCECPICLAKFPIRNIFAAHFIEKHYRDYMKKKCGEETKRSSKDRSEKRAKNEAKPKVDIFGNDFAVVKTLKPTSSNDERRSLESIRNDSKECVRVEHRRTSTDQTKSKPDSSKHNHSSPSKKKDKSSSKHKSLSSHKEKKESDLSIEKQDSENDDTPIPASRVRQTLHTSATTARPIISSANPVSAARQKLMDNWKKDSIDSQRFEIEQLKARINEMTSSHEEALKKKTEDFERWITQREKALEEESERRKVVEKQLEELTVVNEQTKLQLVQQQTKNLTLQEEFDEQASLCQQVEKEKKKVEKEMSELRSEFSQLQRVSDEKSEDLKAFRDHMDEKLEEIRQLEDSVKELKSNEERLKLDFQKQISRLERNVESNVKKVEKMTEEKKNRAKEMKEMTKKHNDEVDELKNQILELTTEVKELNMTLESQKIALEKSAMTEMKRLELDQSRIEKKLEQHESQLTEKNQTIEKLETQKNGLLDSLVHMQKLVKGFEVIIGDKNETLQEQEGKIADLEALVEDSVDKANKLKVVEKEKKELQKQVKHLQATLKDWESRQFSNASLISGLEKTKAALEQKVKNFEENHTGAEQELYEMTVKIRNLEKEVKRLKEMKENAESEHAHTKARLQTKVTELVLSTSKVEELEQTIRNLEREVRNKGCASDDVVQLKQTIANKEAELSHLRIDLSNSKSQFNQLKSSMIMVESQLRSHKSANLKLETDYSLAVSHIEILKKTLKDKQLEVGRREQQLTSLRDTVRKDTELIASAMCGDRNNSAGLRQVSQIVANLNVSLFKDEKEATGLVRVKSEPVDNSTDGSTVCVNTDKQIVLNVPKANSVKEEPIIPNPDAFSNESICAEDDNDLSSSSFEINSFSETNLRVESFTSIASSSPSSSSAAPSSSAKSSRKKKAQLEDVTGHYFPDEDNIVCGICHEYDPPPRPGDTVPTTYTTEWVGCDCARWFHKPCTKLQRFTTLFSCRSVKMKCFSGHVPQKGKRQQKKASKQPDAADIVNHTIAPH